MPGISPKFFFFPLGTDENRRSKAGTRKTAVSGMIRPSVDSSRGPHHSPTRSGSVEHEKNRLFLSVVL